MADRSDAQGQAGAHWGINGWTCDSCGRTTYCVDLVEGVTPFMLACRAEGVDPRAADCKGMAESMFYPRRRVPPHVVNAVAWEWYRPSARATRKLDRASREHVENGGLMLRPLTDEGRAALAASSRELSGSGDDGLTDSIHHREGLR